MAVAVAFKDWLDEKLRELNTDENIFGSYIQSILEGDEPSEEKTEALQGIISEIIENDVEITKLCEEILEKWKLNQPKEPPPTVASSEEINEKLAKLLECQLPTTKQKQYTEEEKKIREAILSQYSEMTDSEEEADIGDSGAGTGNKEKDAKIEKNVNAQLVADAEKVKRENAKVESQKKKEKDREDREKQKNLKEEKKEKRKTQKGERRR